MLSEFLSKNLQRLLRYLIVGILTWVIDLGLFILLKKILAVILANTIAITAQIIFGFFAHKYWTFRSHQEIGSQLIKFVSLSLVNIALSDLLMYGLIYQLNLEDITSKVITILLISIESFLITNFFIFTSQNAAEKKTPLA